MTSSHRRRQFSLGLGLICLLGLASGCGLRNPENTVVKAFDLSFGPLSH